MLAESNQVLLTTKGIRLRSFSPSDKCFHLQAITGLNGMNLGDKKLIVQRASVGAKTNMNNVRFAIYMYYAGGSLECSDPWVQLCQGTSSFFWVNFLPNKTGTRQCTRTVWSTLEYISVYFA